MRKFTLLIILAVSCSANAWAELFPPPGYRFPNEADYSGNWEYFKKQYPIPYHVHSDFNGDGLMDDAWLLIHENNLDWGVFAIIRKHKAEPSVITLTKSRKDAYPRKKPQHVGISLVEPGTYVTACGKGHWDCGEGEIAEITLTKPGIKFFVFESSSAFYYWSDEDNAFRGIWISD